MRQPHQIHHNAGPQHLIDRMSTVPDGSEPSQKMLVLFSAGLCLWIAYGVLKGSWVIHSSQFDRRNTFGCRAWV